MKREEVRVFVVEDDRSVSGAIEAAIQRAGFKSQVFSRPDDVIAATKLQFPEVFIIDCLLPKTSGVNLAQELQSLGARSDFIFMSGIYKDKNFIKDTLQKTKAKAFLPKPLDVNQLIAEIERIVGDALADGSLHEPFLEILTHVNASPKERAQAVERTSSIHGFEVPRALSLLSHSTVSGTLTLIENSEAPAKIYIHQGDIVRVDMKMPNSMFGTLLIEKNFVTAEALEGLLKEPSTKPIGQRLVDACLISPHVIQIVNQEQTGIRLSQLIKNTSYQSHFTFDQPIESNVCLSSRRLTLFFSDWIYSKIDSGWLKTFYLPWMAAKVLPTSSFDSKSPVFKLPPVSLMPGLADRIQQHPFLQDLLTDKRFTEDELLGAVHLLVYGGQLAFERRTGKSAMNLPIDRLKKILAEIQSKNFFEILGIPTTANPSDIKKGYFELAKTFHPDKLAANSAPELVDLANQIFQRITTAYNTLRDDERRQDYLRELEHGQAEKIIRGEAFLDEGTKLLKSGYPSKAIEKLDEARKLGLQTTELNLLATWAKILISQSSNKQGTELNEAQTALNRVPPEDRHTALYFFVRGLYFRISGELDQAVNALKQSLYLSPTFIEAQRELKLIQSMKKSASKDLLHADLTEVVGMLFKKRK